MSWQTSEYSCSKSKVLCQLSLIISYSQSPCGTSNSRKRCRHKIWYFEAQSCFFQNFQQGDIFMDWLQHVGRSCLSYNLLIIKLLHHIPSLGFALKSRFPVSLKKAGLWGWAGFPEVKWWLSGHGSFGRGLNSPLHPVHPCSFSEYIDPDSPILSEVPGP